MTADPARPVRELLDHGVVALERIGIALRRGLPPAALAECEAQLKGPTEELGRLAGKMVDRAFAQEEGPTLAGHPVVFKEPEP